MISPMNCFHDCRFQDCELISYAPSQTLFDGCLTVLSPLSRPLEVPTADDWSVVEHQLGKLPADYKAFVARFGTGTINTFIWVLNPISKNHHLNLLQEKEPILGALRELQQSGEPCPYRLHPQSGGLLPFGKTDHGDVLFWLTKGEPEKWPIVVNAARDPTYEKFDCSATDFLAGILMRKLRSSVFHDSFPSHEPTFTPLVWPR